MQGIQVSIQVIDGQQHLFREYTVVAQGLEHGDRTVKLVLGALQMERAHTDRYIGYLKRHRLTLLTIQLRQDQAC